MNGRRLPAAERSSFLAAHGWALAETLLVFGVFFVQGATPPPDVGETYYLGKAVHYWNPDWAQGDFFLDTKDAHEVFYYTFGWLSLWLPLGSLAWVGRILTWGLLAWAWRRLSFAVLPRRGYAVLSAALMVCLVQRCHMAGEWIVGGVEAKGFAFVLVLLGMESLVRGRWNRVWLLLGAASAFHVLVGGWSVVAAAIGWILCRRPGRRWRRWLLGDIADGGNLLQPPSPPAPLPASGARGGGGEVGVTPIWSMIPALIGGLVLSLPGLIPAIRLDWGVDAKTMAVADFIYVFRRLSHHLDPGQIPVYMIARFVGLGVLWLLLCRATPADAGRRRLRAFVAGAVAIALAGAAVCWLSFYDMELGAALLRYYWFRLADVMVPVGVAVEGVWFALARIPSRPAFGRSALAVVILVATAQVGAGLVRLTRTTIPRAFQLSDRVDNFRDWQDACRWVVTSGAVPPDARFITPAMSQTFKWYAGRAEVANWKEIPQDARAIVEWRERVVYLYRADHMRPQNGSLPRLRAKRLRKLGEAYGADYVIAAARPRLDLPVVHENASYAVYRIEDGERAASAETTERP